MHLRPAVLALASLLSLSSLAQAEAPPWPQAHSDLKPDPAITFGELENGLRYVIMPNKEPPGRASLRLHMDVGSLMEEDDQQGMAHFLEHMAFNGSKNYAAGSLVEYFQRLGMGFGADTNAHTSFKETVYQLELPKVDDQLMADAMKLFRDDLDGMLLGAAEIDKERGVILSEKLARDSVDYRTMLAGFSFALPDGKISRRLPIGVENTLKTMGRARFVDFFETWYTPRRAIVIVVGDVDVPMVKKHIEAAFASAKPKRGDVKDPDFGKVSAGRGIIAKLHSEPEAAATDISIEIMAPASQAKDSAAHRRELMVRNAADAMLNQRFSKLVKAENAPFLGAESYSYEYLRFVEVNGVMAKCKPESWKEALAVIETEVRRALQHGFTEAEFAEAKAGILKGAKLNADTASTRKSKALAAQLSSVLASDKVFTEPKADLTRVEQSVASLTKEECLAALQKSWANKDIQVFVGGNLKLEGDAPAAILAAYQASAAKPVAAPAAEETVAFAYTEFGPAGKVAKTTEVKDLEITQLAFENGVRVNYKKTPFQKNTLSIAITFGGGKLDAPADKPGLVAFTGSVFEAGGLEKHSADDLRRIFASKTLSADFNIGDDAFMLSGRTTPEDVEAQLQLLTAYLTAPGYREEAERTFRQGIDPMYTEMEHTAEGVMQDKVVAFIHNGDPRFGAPPQAALKERTLAEAKAWLSKPLTESYMEVGIVGDFDADKLVAALSKTLGALPKRAAQKADYAKQREVKFPAEPKQKNFLFSTEIERAYALVYWPTTDMSNIQRARRLMLLSSVLDDRMRLKIREELGESYSPTCYHLPSDTYTGYGYVSAIITLKPDQVAKVGPIVAKLGDELATGKITPDEFDRARKPQLTALEQQRRDNNYWLIRVLKNCQEKPERLDWARSLVDDIAKIEVGDLEALAKEFLPSSRATQVGIIPQK